MENQTLVIPEPYTEAWNELKRKTEERFANVFNSIKLENLDKVEENWWENILYIEPTEEDLKDLGYHDEEEGREEFQRQQAEVIWGTLFEASQQYIADDILENYEEISRMGLTVIDCSESGAYETGVFIGVRSAGHDFYAAYWVELFLKMGWIHQ